MILRVLRGASGLSLRSAWVLFASAFMFIEVACDKVPLLAPTGSKLALFAADDSVPLNGSTTITATLLEAAGTPVQNGTVITFTTTLGSIEPREARTSNGSATVRFLAGNQSGTAVINAFSGGSGTSGTTSSTTSTPGSTGNGLQIKVGAAVADSILLVASPATVSPSGGTVQLAATVSDSSGNPVPGIPVSFSADAGTLSASSVTANANGQAFVSLTTTRETKVTARVGTKTADFTVRVNATPVINVTASPATAVATQPVTATISVGTGTGVLSNVRIDSWGDGASESVGTVSGSVSRTHLYCAPGAYTISVTGRDVNSEPANGSAGVAVTPIAPFTLVGNNAAVRQSVNFTATIPAGAIITRYEWDFGDGSTDTTAGPSNSHSYQVQGPKRVTVTAISSQCGAVANATTGVNITP